MGGLYTKENDTIVEMINTRILVQPDNQDLILVKCDWFKVDENEYMPTLSLSEIAKQLEVVYGDNLFIDVWVELGLAGYIYRYNSMDKTWSEHGRTRGFA
ncbi:hypothetical protein AWM68_17275 [Fictibacillus phosphorivorans]|uniref:Uncharacterized protein n=1 Tax=Fictibacillus phosphorivorans TaxID=1221500 RepID=A0A165NW64_9BACL|nr:hypothetical protein [Fictibacillus phosphorivorans]KZE67925.1 hypothetical protein AWM68_17275 [Fictibacillus phosphorivorans]